VVLGEDLKVCLEYTVHTHQETSSDNMATIAPPISLPPGNEYINVKMINPVNFGPAILQRFMAPAVPNLETFKSSPSLSFLLEHPSGRKLVFDLGIRKDFSNYAPSIRDYLPTTKYKIDIENDVAATLRAQQVSPESIEAVIWRQAVSEICDLEHKLTSTGSHWHWDHIGDPSTFPSSTALIVGPGFKKAMLPGAPANPNSPILESDYTCVNQARILTVADT